MIAGPIVTVVVNGRRIDASHAARLDAGTVVGPLVPFVREFAERIDGDGTGRRFAIERGGRRIVVYVLPGRSNVPLAAIARALGGSVAYDSATHTLAVWLPPAPIASTTPIATYVPPPTPFPTFAPKATPDPQVTVSGIPHPRRTPILVTPNDRVGR